MKTETNTKFKIGDRFTKNNTRDYPVMEIIGIKYTPIEPVYELEGVIFKSNLIELGEEVLDRLYDKINKK